MPFDGAQNAAVISSLRSTRALIADPEKWCKYTTWDCDGRYCAAGALILVTGNKYSDDFAAGMEYLTRGVRKRGYAHVPGFNDAPGTRHADVLALFDEAIESARADAYV